MADGDGDSRATATGDQPTFDAERTLDALVNAFPDVGFILDGDGYYREVLASPDSESLLLDDPEDLVGARLHDVFPEREAVLFMEEIDVALTEGTSRRFEYPVELGAETRRFEGHMTPVDTAGTEMDAVVLVARDVTEEHRYKSELERQRGYMQELFDAIDDLFFVLGEDGTLVDWNHALAATTGHDDETLEGIDVFRLFDMDDEDARAITRELAATGTARVETDVRTSGGRRVPHEVVVALFEDTDGENLVVGIGRDVTNRREREQQLRVFGRLLRHNIRNKMNVVRGEAEVLGERTDGSLTAELDRIERASDSLIDLAEKAHDVTEVLLEQSYRQSVDVAGFVTDVGTWAGDRFPRSDLHIDADGPVMATGIPALRLATQELVENAVVHADDASASVELTVSETDRAVTITVTDDAPTLPDNEANIVTEQREITPVFHSTGVGLWLVRWIVKRCGGSLDYEPLDPQGNRFTIELRRSDVVAGGDV